MDRPWVAVRDALKQCAQVATWARSPQELIDDIDWVQALSRQLAALNLELVRELDAQGIPARQGAANTTAWIRDRYRLSGHTASQQVKLATALDTRLPETAAALADGVINPEQAQLIAKAVPTLPGQYQADGEKFLIAQCGLLGPRELGWLAERLPDRIAPQVAEQRAAERLARSEQRAYADRRLHLTDLHGDARVRVSGWLDRESAAIVRAALDPLCAPRTDRDGCDERSPGQRRADALVEVCRLALACEELPENGGDRPQVVVTIDLDDLREQTGAATLDDGTVLSPAAARRFACDALILPAVLGSTGQVLDVGRERRLFTGPLRRALVLRDGGCGFPGCDRPARWCEGHHVIAWLDNGPTNLNNAVLLCGHHHRVIHQGHWQVRIATDGLPEFIPPPYIDPQQQPRRNTYHRRE